MILDISGRLVPGYIHCMTELGAIFAELGISHYLTEFVEQGFDTWDTILDITESDFDALNVKLGHRRKIQRKIALSRGLSSDRALASPSRHTPSEDRASDEQKPGNTKSESRDGSNGVVQGAKRKYRRHPKADENAPERPPSAYVIFSNKMREDLKGRHLSFTEIAKLVGEDWQNLSPHEREPYEQQAATAKEKYINELTEYKKTEQYKEYSQYLLEFKARQAQQQQTTDSDSAKRPKLEAHASANSTGTNSSGTSQYGSEPSSGRPRVDSGVTNGPYSSGSRNAATPTQSPVVSSKVGGAVQTSPRSTNPASPPILPGYRDSKYPGTIPNVPRRDGVYRNDNAHNPSLRTSEVIDMHANHISGSQGHLDNCNLTGSLQHAHRTSSSHPPPPLLTSESTASTSTTSSFFNPRTPMEPIIDRALPIPSIHSQKSYENQLPPLRSSQTSSLVVQHSPHGMRPIMDFPIAMAPIRGLGQPPLTQGSQPPLTIVEDIALDPVSALLRAGEIVDRNSRNWPT